MDRRVTRERTQPQRAALAARRAHTEPNAGRLTQLTKPFPRFERARRLMPGGVNSPVRAWKAVGGEPLFIQRGQGAWIWDASGRRYLDLVGGFGPLILGHSHPDVAAAIAHQAQLGTSFGAPTEGESELAQLIVDAVQGVKMLRLVSSGTEAVMSAVRLARAATGRRLLVIFAGGYHGHADHVLADAGSGVATFGIPGSPGVPAEVVALTAVLPYNDAEGVQELFAARGSEIAAVLVEPIAGNMGVVPARTEWLQSLRALCDKSGALLIFDEVITGFRVGHGGAQAMYGITPDLTTLGKIIGGGMPLAAYGGPANLMKQMAPEGPVYQAGTLSGNPVATAAGIASLRALAADPPYARLDAAGARIAAVIDESAHEHGVEVTVNRVGSMLTPFFAHGPVTDFAGARSSNLKRYARLFHALIGAGVYPPPSQFEAWFLNTAMDEREIEFLSAALKSAFAQLATG